MQLRRIIKDEECGKRGISGVVLVTVDVQNRTYGAELVRNKIEGFVSGSVIHTIHFGSDYESMYQNVADVEALVLTAMKEELGRPAIESIVAPLKAYGYEEI